MNDIKKALALGIAVMTMTLSAFAFDVNDIKVMVQNDVQDDVIINMVQYRGLSSSPSAQDIVELNALGASSTLLSYLSSISSSCPAPSAPVTVAPPTTYMVPQQQVIVTSPPPVYYYPSPRRYYRPGPRFSFWFGGPRWGGGRHRPHHSPRWGGPRPRGFGGRGWRSPFR